MAWSEPRHFDDHRSLRRSHRPDEIREFGLVQRHARCTHAPVVGRIVALRSAQHRSNPADPRIISPSATLVGWPPREPLRLPKPTTRYCQQETASSTELIKPRRGLDVTCAPSSPQALSALAVLLGWKLLRRYCFFLTPTRDRVLIVENHRSFEGFGPGQHASPIRPLRSRFALPDKAVHLQLS